MIVDTDSFIGLHRRHIFFYFREKRKEDESSKQSHFETMAASSISTTSSCTSSPPPEHFLCPISLAVMKTPVRDKRTGHTFERSAILQWIYLHHDQDGNGNATCPLTRRTLRTENLCLDLDLQREIRAWKQNRPMSDCSSSSDISIIQEAEEEECIGADCGWGSSTLECSIRSRKSHMALFQDEDRIARLQNILSRVLQEREKQIQEHLSATRLSY